MENAITKKTETMTELAFAAENSSAVWSSISADTRQGAADIYNALSGASIQLSSMAGQRIRIRDIIIQGRELLDKQTGEITVRPRIMLIDEDGTCYHSYAKGIVTSVRTIVGMFGSPAEWDEPLEVEITPVSVAGTDGGKTYTLKVVV